jgi:hypothetical protein
MHPEHARWSDDTYLLADAVDLLQGGNWQRGGGKGSRPKPVRRPGQSQGKQYGRTDLTHEQAKEVLARFRPRGG